MQYSADRLIVRQRGDVIAIGTGNKTLLEIQLTAEQPEQNRAWAWQFWRELRDAADGQLKTLEAKPAIKP